MIAGVNVDANAGMEGVIMATSEQSGIPPANAKIGGTSPISTIPFMPVGSLLIAGVIGVTLLVADAAAQGVEAPIEISVVPSYTVYASQMTEADLREAYEGLRRQALSEGIPFLNAAELEREIAGRKGTRS